MKCQSEGTRCVFLSLAEEKAKTQVTIHEKIDEISKRRNSIHVRPTKLMILCFLVEFCNRWALNSINTRYGTYLLDTFQVSSTTFSYILCAQSAWVCVQQAFIYGLVVRTIGLPIPIVALGGQGVISVLSHIVPKVAHDIVIEYKNGNVEKSRQLQIEYFDLCRDLFCDVNPIPVKAAMNMMGWDVGECRLPLSPLSEANQKKLRATLARHGLV